MSPDPVIVESSGAICSVGIGVSQIATSVRAAISRIEETDILGRNGQPVRMGLVPDEAIGATQADVPPGWTARQKRMLLLAIPAIRQAFMAIGGVTGTPLFLGLAEAFPSNTLSVPSQFLDVLRSGSGIDFDVATSKSFPHGRAAIFRALDAAWLALQEGADVAIAGAVDSYSDLALLARLDAESRLKLYDTPDGFIPGEGAAFLVLRALRHGTSPSGKVVLRGVGLGRDEGHIYADQPSKGEGLSTAIKALTTRIGEVEPCRSVLASFNGESFWAKEWGVAQIRHRRFFAPEVELEHPAEFFGDAGAGLGAILLGIAHHQLTRGTKAGPALVFASSDWGDRGCAYLQLG